MDNSVRTVKPKKIPWASRGASLLGAAITLPVLLVIIAVIFDLTRMYITIVLAQDVALTVAKLANAADPSVDTPTVGNLIKTIPGEDIAITTARSKFWADQIDLSASTFHGADYFTSKELKAFNLGYGYLNNLNSDIAFPIPALTPLTQSDLGGETNCSIYFTFADLVGAIDLTYNYSRIYTVECAIPMWGLQLFGNVIAPNGYITVSRSAYSYQSGGLTP